MAKYLIALLLASLSITSFARDVTILEFPITCLSEDAANAVINKFEEVAILEATSLRDVNDKEFSHPLIVFMNLKTKTYTVLERIGNNSNNYKYCIIAVGPKLMPSSFSKSPSVDVK